MSTVPLWRNRDFVLLETGRLLSTIGTASTSIAYPLLVLAVTHSPAKAGLVSFARLLPAALFGLFAGIAADRWNRKHIMIAADAVRDRGSRHHCPPRPACVLADSDCRVRRGDRVDVLRHRAGRRPACRRAAPPAAYSRRSSRGACGDGDPRGTAHRGRALRARPCRAVRLRRRVVRLLVRLDSRDADAVPGGARRRHVTTSDAGRPRLPLPLGPAVPSQLRVRLRARQLRRGGPAL